MGRITLVIIILLASGYCTRLGEILAPPTPRTTFQGTEGDIPHPILNKNEKCTCKKENRESQERHRPETEADDVNYRRKKREEEESMDYVMDENLYFLNLEKKKNQLIQTRLEDAVIQVAQKERERYGAIMIAERLNQTLWLCQSKLKNCTTPALEYARNESKHSQEDLRTPLDGKIPRQTNIIGIPLFNHQNKTKNRFQEANFEKRFIIRRYFQMAWRALEKKGFDKGEVFNTWKFGADGQSKVDWGDSVLATRKIFWDLGATLVSSLDTLYIMECTKEYQKARDWIESSFNLTELEKDNVIFHVRKSVILYIGGFLSIYVMTGDALYLDKATEMGEILLPAFEIGGGFSCTWYHIKKGCMLLEDEDKKYDPSPYASLNLEFELLSDLSGNEIFREKMRRIFRAAKSYATKPQSWFRNSVAMDHLKDSYTDWSARPIAQSGGTYLNYLLKAWIMGGRQNEVLRETYIISSEQAIKDLIVTSDQNLLYVSSISLDGTLPKTMAHSACYVGGNLALGGYAIGEPFKSKHSLLGEAIANTCHEAYVRTPSKLAPDLFDFTPDGTPEARLSPTIKYKGYAYHPQAIETYLVLWQLTRDPKYRKWGSEILDRMIEKFQNSDFDENMLMMGTLDVMAPINRSLAKENNDDSKQPSHLLAETLKYLFLLFQDDDDFSLNHWVFNTNGHPLPIIGTPTYKKLARLAFQGLTTLEIKEADMKKRIQPPRLPVPKKRALDSLMRQKLAIRNVALAFWNDKIRMQMMADKHKAQWSNTRNNSNFWGLTVMFKIASLDTLFIMGFANEYKETKDDLMENFKILSFPKNASVMYVKKTMIAYVGGIMSCFSLTGDSAFLDRAVEVTQHLLAAYNTTSGLPYDWFEPGVGGVRNSDQDILESTAFASLFIELDHLSHVTKSATYRETNQRMLKIATNRNEKPTSMFRNAIPLDFSDPKQWPTLISQSGGTYVEYLLKSWILGGRKDDTLRQTFITVSEQVIKDLVRTTSSMAVPLTFVGITTNDNMESNIMAHSTCYVGGLLALGGAALGEPFKSRYMQIGGAITFTCQQFYNRSLTGVAPKLFDFNGREPKPSSLTSKGYQLTAQTVESYFIMYRLTYDAKYREWGWQIFLAIQKMYNSAEGRYEGISDTTLPNLTFDATVPGSYFLTETLKYL